MDRIEFARHLRQNPTLAERKLWGALRNRQLDGHRFRRQRPIGKYFADFVCLERKLVVELDGGQHGSTQTEHDAQRTRDLEAEGFRVLRFWNCDVLADLEGVATTIAIALAA